MQTVEKELKYQFSAKDYRIIYQYFADHATSIKAIDQTNYYFDTAELLFDQHGISIRIRELPDNLYQFTFKTSNRSNVKYLKIKDEFTYALTYEMFKTVMAKRNIDDFHLYFEEFRQMLNSIKNKQDQDVCDLHNIGQLTTRRTSVFVEFMDYEVLFDESNYFDKNDYEIECELSEHLNTHRCFIEIFNKLGINPVENSLSKRQRFIRAYKNNN